MKDRVCVCVCLSLQLVFIIFSNTTRFLSRPASVSISARCCICGQLSSIIINKLVKCHQPVFNAVCAVYFLCVCVCAFRHVWGLQFPFESVVVCPTCTRWHTCLLHNGLCGCERKQLPLWPWASEKNKVLQTLYFHKLINVVCWLVVYLQSEAGFLQLPLKIKNF